MNRVDIDLMVEIWTNIELIYIEIASHFAKHLFEWEKIYGEIPFKYIEILGRMLYVAGKYKEI